LELEASIESSIANNEESAVMEILVNSWGLMRKSSRKEFKRRALVLNLIDNLFQKERTC